MVSCALPGCAEAATSANAPARTDARSRMSWSAPLCRSRSGHRNLADVLRHLVALLDRRPLGDGGVPALHVRKRVEVDGLPFVARDPRPDRDVGNGIVVGDEFAIGEPA